VNVYGYVDLIDGGEVRNASFQKLASDPASPVTGQFWYNTTVNMFRYRNNSTTIDLGAATAYNTENAQDDVGNILVDSATVDFTYNDATPSITAAVLDSPLLQGSNKAFILNQDNQTDGTTYKRYAATEQTKLAGIATGATANDTDANLKNRTNHTGTQLANTISDLAGTVKAYRLDEFAQPTADLNFGGRKVTNAGVAVSGSDLPTLAQVQDLINSGTNKTAVRTVSTVNLALANAVENGDTVGGVTVATGNRVLLVGQTAPAENGIYTVNASGAPTRAADADIGAEVKGGLSVWVNEGTNADSRWVLTTDDPITLGTTGLTFVKDFAIGDLVAGAGLTKTGSTVNVVANADATITVNADDIQVNKANVSLRKTQLFGNGALTSFTIAHGMGTKYLVGVTVYKESNGEVVYPIVTVDATNINISGFGTAPAASAFCVAWG
jgi:hypothetical protein